MIKTFRLCPQCMGRELYKGEELTRLHVGGSSMRFLWEI